MKITEVKLRQIIREELMSELMGPDIDSNRQEASTDQPFLDNVPSPFEWWKNATDYWGNTEDSPSIEAFHKTLNGLEMIPLVSIPAGIMNALIHHARGDKTRALMSLGFAATGGLTAVGLKSAIKAPGAAQKIFASLGNAAATMAGQLKGHKFTLLLKNPEAAHAALRSILAFSPAAGELVEEELAQTFIEVDKEVQDGDKAWKKLRDSYTGGMSHPDHPHASVDPSTNP